MTQSAPWRDALKRAGATSRAGAAALPPQPTSTFVPDAGSIDPMAVSPHLAALLNEREQLQAKMAALTGAAGGGGMSDPRYAVAGMTERRVDFQRWADARDARRSPVKRDSERPRSAGTQADAGRSAGIDSVAGRMIAPKAKALDVVPALRPTPGERAGGGGTPLDAQAFADARDAGRALFAPPAERSRSSNDRSGLLDRAIDRWAETRDRARMAEAALGKARRAIPEDWQRRAKAAIPALSDPKGYAERARELLTVAVGSIDQLTELADKMRDVRELKAADEAHDDARRERALAKLKAKRREEA